MDVIAENGPVSLLFSHITCSIDPKPCFSICVPRFFLCSSSGVKFVVFLSVIGSRRNSMACPILRATMVKMWRSGQPRKRDQCIEVVSEDVSANSLNRSWLHQTLWHQFMIFLQRIILCMVMMCFGRSCTTIWTQLQHIATWRWCTNIPRPQQPNSATLAQHGPAWPSTEGWVSIRRAEKGQLWKKEGPSASESRLHHAQWITASHLDSHLDSRKTILDTILDPCESQGVWVAGHRDFRWQSILWCRDRAPALAWTRRERAPNMDGKWAHFQPFLQVCPGKSGWYSRSFLSDISACLSWKWP